MSKLIVMGVIFVSMALGITTYSPTTHAQATPGQYASINGLELYYEIHGTGEPLILLHGGFGGAAEFGALLPALAETRQVIAVELQGHGHTADVDRPLSYEAMADDVAALIVELGFEKVDIAGFSLGGGVALQAAIRHPEVVKKLVLISTSFRRSGWYPEALAGMEAMQNPGAAEAMLQTPMYQFYSSVAPKVDNWPTLVAKLAELLATDYDWSADVAELTLPVLYIVGDADSISHTHATEMFALLGGGTGESAMGIMPQSQFAVLPATNHFTILTRTDLLLPIINPFLDAVVAE